MYVPFDQLSYRFKQSLHQTWLTFSNISFIIMFFSSYSCCTITRVEVLSIGTDNKCVDSRYANTEGIQSMHVIQLSYIYAILNEDNWFVTTMMAVTVHGMEKPQPKHRLFIHIELVGFLHLLLKELLRFIFMSQKQIHVYCMPWRDDGMLKLIYWNYFEMDWNRLKNRNL